MYNPENQPELFQAFLRGDESAVKKYYDLYTERAFVYLNYLIQNKVVAEDLAIEAFWKMYERRDCLNDEKHLLASLLLTARYLFRKHARAQAHDHQLKGHLSRQSENEPPGINPEEEKEEVIKDLERSISGLTERRRTVLELHYFQGLPIKDIANRLSLSEHTINNTLAQTLKILRGELFELWGKKNPGLS